MIKEQEQYLPKARTERLLIEPLPDEVLVYDLDRKKAHCLNGTAALIWNHCDGKTSVDEIAIILGEKSASPADKDVVWLGLDRLQKARLIDEPVVMPAGKERLSRRELVKKIGLAVSIPLVTSIMAPVASAALSCAHAGCIPGCVSPCTCIAGSCQ
jgi:hypothetical protein